MNPDEDRKDPNNNAPLQPNNAGANDDKKDPSDVLTPDHPRFKEVNEQLRQMKEEKQGWDREKQQLLDRLDNLERKREAGTNDDEDELTESEQKALDRIERGLRKKGFVTQDLFQSTQNADKLTRLQEQHNGKDGLPKFVPDDVVVYAKKNGFGNNFAAAYRDMHYDAILQIEADKRSKGITPPDSEKPTGSGEGDRNPDPNKVSAEDIEKMSDAEYEKYREDLLMDMKRKSKNDD